jgi:hypothetical protein
MGTGYTVDTPIFAAPLGIDSVISLVDDLLLERIRKFYCGKYGLPFEAIPPSAEDGRARRVKAYLDTVREIVNQKFAEIQQLPFFADNEKKRYFELLPDSSELKKSYKQLLQMQPGEAREALCAELNSLMKPGSIDVNIMVKLDKVNKARGGGVLPAGFSDAQAALRGFAESAVHGAVVLSAGINQGLFNVFTQFDDFYRNAAGELSKRIVLKVSDFRSAVVQGKLLAKKGLEVSEYRIESGLNCGGHAFPTDGVLLPKILKEFNERREDLTEKVLPILRGFYQKKNWTLPRQAEEHCPKMTVQGGIGNSGEVERLMRNYGADATGWGTPFLLVPEMTRIDETTRRRLEKASEKDLYLSGSSPLGIPFNNLRGSTSEDKRVERINSGTPGSPCPKKFLALNEDYGKNLCPASTEFMEKRQKDIEREWAHDPVEYRRQIEKMLEKSCICHELGNGALVALGIVREAQSPVAVCPGPNLAWFNSLYSTEQMVDHIYGRGENLAPAKRPHMFANELVLYINYLEQLINDQKIEGSALRKFVKNLEEGMEYLLKVAGEKAYPRENLASIRRIVMQQKQRLITLLEPNTAMAV